MRKLILLFLLAFSSANAKTLVISDIDDTIKVSHVLSWDKFFRASDVTTPFAGMADLYRAVLAQNPEQTRIVYLSNAPEKLAGVPALEISHKTFLSLNRFPFGNVELRGDIFDQNHKINTIRSLMENEKPDLVILVGDNGERDPEIYHQAFAEYGGKIRMLTFIHQLYSSKKSFLTPAFLAEQGKKLFSEQVGFVTPIEISLELGKQGLMSRDGVDGILQTLAPGIVSENIFKWDGLKPITFPRFKNCKDFVWRWTMAEELKPLYQKIMSQCR